MKVIKPLGIIIGALAVYYGIQIFYSFVFAVISIFVTDASFTAMEAYLMQQALPISLVSTVVTLTVFCLYPVMRRRNPLSYFYCRKIPLYALPLLLVFGLAASFTVNFIWSYLPFPEELWENYNETVNSMLGGDPVLVPRGTVKAVFPFYALRPCTDFVLRDICRGARQPDPRKLRLCLRTSSRLYFLALPIGLRRHLVSSRL